MNAQIYQIVLLSAALLSLCQALKCYKYDTGEKPWEKIQKFSTAYLEECLPAVKFHEKNFPHDELPEEEIQQMNSWKIACIKVELNLQQVNTNMTMYRGYCSYYRKYFMEPCKRLSRDVKEAMGLGVKNCHMCATDACNIGDFENFDD